MGISTFLSMWTGRAFFGSMHLDAEVRGFTRDRTRSHETKDLSKLELKTCFVVNHRVNSTIVFLSCAAIHVRPNCNIISNKYITVMSF